MEKYEKKYESVLDKLFNNLNLNHIADSDNFYVRQCDEHTINQVASARAFLWLQKFCGKDGRVRAFGQLMPQYDSITTYDEIKKLPNGEIEKSVNFMDINYHSSHGFSIKDGGYVSHTDQLKNAFWLRFWHPYKQKFNHKNIDNVELTKYGSNDVLLERTKYLNDMRLAA